MSHYQNQYAGGTPQVDEYGNPIGVDEHGRRTHTDEYGNPTHHTDTRYGTGGFDTTTLQGMRPDATVPTHGGDYRHDQQQQHQGLSGMLHRSGSGSSSSSEDDGMGGRRKKKGVTEKIKEKIPGVGHKHDDPYHHQQGHTTSSTTATPGYNEGQQHHQEKKGVMEKIKEKLPGHH